MIHYARTAALGALLLCITACSPGQIKLTIDESRVQSQVIKEFPQHHDLKGLAKLTMKNPVVDLGIGENRIGLTTDLEVSRDNLPIAIKGQTKTSGKLRYEPKEGAFYMTDVRVEDMNLPIKLIGKKQKQKIIDTANAALQGTLKDIAVYTLENSSSKEATNALLKSVTIKDKKVHITMGMGS